MHTYTAHTHHTYTPPIYPLYTYTHHTPLYPYLQVGISPHDIIWKFLQKKDSRDIELRSRVIDVMPRLASVYYQTFLYPNIVTKQLSFLQYFIKHLISIIKLKKERSLAYNTLGKLFYTCPALGTSTSTALVEDIMVCVYRCI